MTRSASMVWLLAGAGLLACVERPLLGDDSGGAATSTGGGDELGEPPTTGATSGPAASTGGPGSGSMAGETGIQDMTTGGAAGSTGAVSTSGTTSADPTCGFICETEHGHPTPVECDVFAQNCDDGEKCAPYAEGGGSSWNATQCVPVIGGGEFGDPCTAPDGPVGGLDDCAKGFFCWDVDERNHGSCVALCTGSPESPACSDEEKFYCAITSDSVINLCLTRCDPLAQDCPGDDLCVPTFDTFVCALDASGPEGQLFDPCEFVNACDSGLFCSDAIGASECQEDAYGCCLPFCDLSDPDPACPGAQQVCIPFFGEGMAPEKYKDVGGCNLMP